MYFKNREEAALLLADRLVNYRGQHPLVLGVPRSAVPMARTIAEALDGDLDVVLVSKLGARGQPGVAIGAVDESGNILRAPYLNLERQDDISEEVRTQQEILRKRRALYTQAQRAVNRTGRLVIIVDDGIVTGSSMLAAIRSVRAHQPRKIVVAIPVAQACALGAIRRETEDVVCLHAAHDLHALGHYFGEFPEVTDGTVVAALAHSPTPAPQVA